MGGRNDDARAQGEPVAAPQPGILSAPILRCEPKRPQPRASQQGPPADVTSDSTASVDVNPPHFHESRPWETRQRNKWRYGFVRAAHHVH